MVDFLGELITPTNIAVAGLGIGIATIAAAKRSGFSSIGGVELPTEQALTSYSLVSGIGGAAAQIIAGRQLSQVPNETVSLGSIAAPVAISIGATAFSAFLLPSQ